MSPFWWMFVIKSPKQFENRVFYWYYKCTYKTKKNWEFSTFKIFALYWFRTEWLSVLLYIMTGQLDGISCSAHQGAIFIIVILMISLQSQIDGDVRFHVLRCCFSLLSWYAYSYHGVAGGNGRYRHQQSSSIENETAK